MKKERIIFHIDVNSAYVSFTAVDLLKRGVVDFDISEVPSIICGDVERRCGVVLAASVPAKEWGVKTGETVYLALKKCPKLIMYKPDFGVYVRCNSDLVQLLYEYTPQIQVFSIDEAFIDVTHFKENYMEKAIEIKERVRRELGFKVNIGISTNKLLAKQASDFKPKDSIHTLFHHEIKRKLWNRPVGELFLVGKKTEPKLNQMNIFTIGELANYDVRLLEARLKSHGRKIHNYANGIEDSKVSDLTEVDPKAIGNSVTLKFDVKNKEYLFKMLLALTEKVAHRLREKNSLCMEVAVSYKTGDFNVFKHQKQMKSPTDSTNDIYEYIKATFLEMWRGEPVRQIGISIGKLDATGCYQVSLFDDVENEKKRKLDSAIDSIRKKYGNGIVKRLTFLEGDINCVEGGTTEEYSPKISGTL